MAGPRSERSHSSEVSSQLPAGLFGARHQTVAAGS